MVKRIAVVTALVVAIAFPSTHSSAASGRAYHTQLVSSEPMKDSTVRTAPTQLKLVFSEGVKPSLAGVRLIGSDSATVSVGALKQGDKPTTIVAPITGTVKPGAYRVNWRVAGDDGHPVTGTFTFRFQPPR